MWCLFPRKNQGMFIPLTSILVMFALLCPASMFYLSNTKMSAKEVAVHLASGVVLSPSPIHYFKLNTFSPLNNVYLKKRKHSKLYRLPLRYVSNGKPVDILLGTKTLKRTVKDKPSKVTVSNKRSRIYELHTKFVSNGKPSKNVVTLRLAHTKQHYTP